MLRVERICNTFEFQGYVWLQQRYIQSPEVMLMCMTGLVIFCAEATTFLCGIQRFAHPLFCFCFEHLFTRTLHFRSRVSAAAWNIFSE